jgi:hypothetical protein
MSQEINLLDQKNNIDNDVISNSEYKMRCCCFSGSADRRILLFGTQIGFSLMTSVFCIYKLSVTSDPNVTSIYLPLLSSIVTLWLPMPQIKNKK